MCQQFRVLSAMPGLGVATDQLAGRDVPAIPGSLSNAGDISGMPKGRLDRCQQFRVLSAMPGRLSFADDADSFGCQQFRVLSAMPGIL